MTQRPRDLPDRPPPHDLAAERAVLGSILLDPARADDVADILRPGDFYGDGLETVYGVLQAMRSEGVAIDTLSVRSRLVSAGWKSEVATQVVGELAMSVPVANHARYHAKTVAREAAFRRLIHVGQELSHLGFAQDSEPEDALDRAEEALHRGWRGRHDRAPVTAADALADLTTDLDEIAGGKRPAGLMTGLPTFDSHFGGLFPGELVVVAARPGIGKTALACQVAVHAARKGESVYFVSLEMPAKALLLRVLCGQAGVSSKLVRCGAVNREQTSRLVKVSRELADASLFIHDAPSIGVGEIRRNARRLHRKGLALVVIDYLQRLQPRDRRLNRDQQVGEMSTALKALALELSLPVLCLVQLNREAEKDSRPRLGHLRESGSIEADADVVAMLQRNEAEKPDPGEPVRATLHVVKNRNGETGAMPLLWNPARTMFSCEDDWL